MRSFTSFWHALWAGALAVAVACTSSQPASPAAQPSTGESARTAPTAPEKTAPPADDPPDPEPTRSPAKSSDAPSPAPKTAKSGKKSGPSKPQQGQPCPRGVCASGLTCVEYYGIAGPRGPKFTSCEIRCAGKAAMCPPGQTCVTIADGPGQVCRPR